MLEHTVPGIYGTADAMEIVHVAFAALGFCPPGAVIYMVVYMLLA